MPVDGPASRTAKLRTAGGIVDVAFSHVPQLTIAGKRFANVPVAIMPGPDAASLLGHDILRSFDMTIADDMLELRSRS